MRSYELSDHLGNVRVVLSDLKKHNSSLNVLEAQVLAAFEYYPFGMAMQSINLGSYRYGFNGMEREDQLTGLSGGHYDFGSRIYDPRLVRFLSIDPFTSRFPYQTPYAFANNTPIQATDQEGKFANFIIKYGIEVGINIALQMVTSYMMDDDVKTWGDAWDNVSMWDAFSESALDVVGPGKLKMVGQAAVNIFNYIDKVGIENVTTQGLMEAGLSSIIENTLGDKAGKMGSAAFQKGMKKLGLNPSKLDADLSNGSPSPNVKPGGQSGNAKGRLENDVDVDGKNTTERNHMPSKNAYKLAGFNISDYMGSAIKMSKVDHSKFISTGRSGNARNFRKQEAMLLSEGKFMEAFDLNVREVRSQFFGKYDKAIKEAREQFKKEVMPELQKQYDAAKKK